MPPRHIKLLTNIDEPHETEEEADTLLIRKVDAMKVLGSMINHEGAARYSLQLNQAKCERNYWANKCLQSCIVRKDKNRGKLVEA